MKNINNVLANASQTVHSFEHGKGLMHAYRIKSAPHAFTASFESTTHV